MLLRTGIAATVVATALTTSALCAQTGSGTVSAQANVFRAGGNGSGLEGIDPLEIILPGSGSLWTVTFTADGIWNHRLGLDPLTGPDGGYTGNPGTNINSSGSIAGIAGPYNMWLTGVFLADDLPISAPSRRIYSGYSDPVYPDIQLGQVFFTGDGLTGTGSGTLQVFNIPEGATRLFLGVVDGFSFQGDPATYSDNIGELYVGWTISGPTVEAPGDVVPEPATLTLTAIGLSALAIRRRNGSAG